MWLCYNGQARRSCWGHVSGYTSELALLQLGDAEDQEGDREGRGRGRQGQNMSMTRENENPSHRVGQPQKGGLPRVASKPLPLDLAPCGLSCRRAPPHPCFCWSLRPDSPAPQLSPWRKQSSQGGCRNQGPHQTLQEGAPETHPCPMGLSLSPSLPLGILLPLSVSSGLPGHIFLLSPMPKSALRTPNPFFFPSHCLPAFKDGVDSAGCTQNL